MSTVRRGDPVASWKVARTGPDMCFGVISRRRSPVVRTLAAVTAGILLSACSGTGDGGTVDSAVEPPEAVFPERWAAVLGSDDAVDIEAIRTESGRDTFDDAAAARLVVERLLVAETTGAGRVAFDSWFEQADVEPACSNVEVIGVLVDELDVDRSQARGSDVEARWAKALAVWNGNCFVADAEPRSTVVYLRATNDVWAPVRPGAIPQVPVEQFVPNGVVPDWALSELRGCTAVDTAARLEVTEAWELLCAEAQRSSVALTAVEGFRTAGEQQALLERAEDIYGADGAARRIAYSDGEVCESKHCAGVAIDIVPDPNTLAWLDTPVGCADMTSGAPVDVCEGASRPVTRSESFGFTRPLASSPGHLEFVFPLLRIDGGGDCAAPVTAGVLEQIVSAWRCVLSRSGLTRDQRRDVVAHALTVAASCSELDPAWRYEQGRFVSTIDPRTGRTHTEAGLFALRAPLRDGWTPAGEDPDSVRGQALAAARVWVAERDMGRDGWGQFGCHVETIAGWAYDYLAFTDGA